jgi:NitT/TauT family transport system ATP-binding protein
MNGISAKNLRKSYGEQLVLNDVSFELPNQGITCIMAPSGVGKTTLLRILLGLEQPDSGTVSRFPDCHWAAVFQEDRLLEHLDAMGNLRFVLGNELDAEDAKCLLAELGLTEAEGKPVRDFSGGMKRRVALARALLAPSDALALDEPFTGLDEENREKAISCILKRTAGKTVLLVTHNEDDAAGLNAEVIHL